MNDISSSISERLRRWFSRAIEAGASDLHLIVGYPPVLRLHGDLIELKEPPLSEADGLMLADALCPPESRSRFEELKNLDFSFDFSRDGQVSRFRANMFHTGRQMGACLRVVPTEIPDFEWTGFPLDLAKRLAFQRDGLVIVTGATGSGKTTTLAMIVNLLNQKGGYRIITVEEPVEYVYPRSEFRGDTARSRQRCSIVCRRLEIRSTARPRRHSHWRNTR